MASLSVSQPVTSDGKQASDADSKSWSLGLLEVIKGTIAVGHENLVVNSFFLAKTPEDYVRLISFFAEARDEKRLWKYLRPGCEPKQVVQHLSDFGSRGFYRSTHGRAIEVMLAAEVSWPWDQLGGLGTRLQSGQPLVAEEAASLLEALLLLRQTGPKPQQALSAYVQGGLLFDHLQANLAQGIPVESLALPVLVVMVCDPETNRISISRMITQNGRNTYLQMVANPDKSKETFSSVAKKAVSLQCLEDLLRNRTPTSTARPAFDFVLRVLANDPNCHEYFTGALIVSQYGVLKSSLDEDSLERLLRASIEKGGFENSLVQADFTLENCGLYRRVLQIRRSEMLVESTVRGLKSLGENDWVRTLEEKNELLPLVLDLTKWEVPLGLGHLLQDALIDFAEKRLSHDTPSHVTRESCNALFSALGVEQRTVFKKNLLDKVIGANSSVARLIIIFPDILADCELLSSKVDELVRVAFRKILERQQVDEYAWIISVLQGCPQITERCPPDVKQDMVERIQGFDTSKLDAAHTQLLSEIGRLCSACPRKEGSPPAR